MNIEDLPLKVLKIMSPGELKGLQENSRAAKRASSCWAGVLRPRDFLKLTGSQFEKLAIAVSHRWRRCLRSTSQGCWRRVYV